MSTFEVKVVRIDEVTNHPNADRLSLNRISGFIAVSNKVEENDGGYQLLDHRYAPNDLVVYVPEGAVVPLEVLQQFGYTDADGKGILAGSKGNRVKAIKLRGIVSQGLIFPLRRGEYGQHLLNNIMVVEGQDVAELLGIVKYEPEIPASMSGDVVYQPALTLKFDLENQQKYPDVFDRDEEVIVTEKLHGTFCGFVFVDASFVAEAAIDVNDLIKISDNLYATAYSKGLGAQGLVFKATLQNVERNIYLRALKNYATPERINDLVDQLIFLGGKVSILGEVFGKGVQDLTYSLDNQQFLAFNIVSRDGQYMSAQGFYNTTLDGALPSFADIYNSVPVVFRGTYGDLIDNLPAYRDGKSLIDGITLREGIVVVPLYEDRDDRIGRKALKIVSPDYLLRKNGTEYN